MYHIFFSSDRFGDAGNYGERWNFYTNDLLKGAPSALVYISGSVIWNSYKGKEPSDDK